LKGGKKKKRRGPKKKYESIHEVILWKCWGLSGCVCAEKLQLHVGSIHRGIEKNNRFSMYELSKTEEAKKVCLGTLKRMISRFPLILHIIILITIRLYLKCFLKR